MIKIRVALLGQVHHAYCELMGGIYADFAAWRADWCVGEHPAPGAELVEHAKRWRETAADERRRYGEDDQA